MAKSETDFIESAKGLVLLQLRAAHSLSETERRQARKVGLTAAVQLNDGTVYHPPGGGYMSDGTAAIALFQADKTLELLEKITAYIKGYDWNFKPFLKGVTIELKFQLELVANNHFLITERTTDVPVAEFDQQFTGFSWLVGNK